MYVCVAQRLVGAPCTYTAAWIRAGHAHVLVRMVRCVVCVLTSALILVEPQRQGLLPAHRALTSSSQADARLFDSVPSSGADWHLAGFQLGNMGHVCRISTLFANVHVLFEQSLSVLVLCPGTHQYACLLCGSEGPLILGRLSSWRESVMYDL